MSRKPLKHSDLKNANALGRKARRTEHLEPFEYYLIVCEGKKTEPQYFEEIQQLINAHYKHRVKVVEIDIRPEATNTIFLLERARQYVKELREQVTQVWLVYDKDDFPLDRFDTTQRAADELTKNNDGAISYNAAWSNQCIEYWFLLHFENLQADIDRKQYSEKLSGYFQKVGLGKYYKNQQNIFSVLREHGNLQLAIRHAEQRLKYCEGKTPSYSVPATKVHLLVQELLKYLPEE